MSERVVKVSLTAQVSNYLAGMEKARQATEKASKESTDAKAKFEAQNQAMTEIGQGMLAVGALAAVGVAIAVKKFADFDEAMSNVKAATQETAENMGLLREAALKAGAETVFSATEAANAIEELGKNGLTTAQILEGGLDGALSLASAGQLDVARAAEIASISMKQFGLAGKDIPHIADLLAAGAGKAAGDVEDLAQALNQSALVAAQTGLSIEETTGLLAAFADAGLTGSDAGTSLKSALQRLTPVSEESAKEMERLGISAYDQQGNFIGAAKFAGVLQDSLGDLTVEQRNAAMAQIFGSDAVRAASILYDQGADGIKKYIDQTNDSGYAAKVAADRLNNLNGDVEKLGGAFDTYLIRSGSGANDILRALTQGATGLVDAIGSLPTPVLNGALALGGLVAAISLAGGVALVAVPKVVAFQGALQKLNISGSTAARGIGLAAGALAVAGIAFGIWAGKQAEATAMAAEFKDSLDDATGATTDYTRELVAKKLAESGAFEAAKEAGISQKELTDAVLEGGDALDAVNAKINGNNTLVDFFSGVGFRAGNARDTIKELSTGLDRSEKDFKDQKAAAEESAEGTDTAATAYKAAADRASELEGNLRELLDTINEANGVSQDAVSSNAAFQDSLAGISEEIETQKAAFEEANGTLNGFTFSLDESTLAGSANASMLSDVAADAQKAAAAQFEVDKKTMSAKDATDKYVKTLANSKKSLEDQATANGANADEVKKLSDRVFALPSQKEVDILVNTATATRQINNWVAIQNGKQVHIAVGLKGNGGLTFADGGYTGSGGKYEPAGIVHRSEFVSTAETTANPDNRRALEYMHRGGVIRGYASGGYVDGGNIRYAAPSGGGGSSSAGSPAFNVVVSAKGGVDLLRYVDVQIQQAENSRELNARRGRQVI